MMSIFYREEPPNPSKRCKCLALALKDAFSNCHSLRRKIIESSPESEEPVSDFDEEEEIFVSAVISKYIESKSKRKSSIGIETCYWALSPEKRDSITTSKPVEKEEFLSASSRLSRCSSATTFDEFVSAKSTCLSRCSSLNRIDFQHFGRRRSIIMEFIHCEGWPFGLCRKALLLPPLPKSPADSWSWKKTGRMIRIHG
ncbi:hypothetical protein CDL12_01989 [Handroanthus impetiginosus]|uniref:Uncharacterized protein n=1 Tax=Handroanthus impetiginosus TaxID=429701 RepID=A0A2G9I667_9LAMI|nr:hypothetical protein CDL12_01989 [Handroanthus impetiginosus]